MNLLNLYFIGIIIFFTIIFIIGIVLFKRDLKNDSIVTKETIMNDKDLNKYDSFPDTIDEIIQGVLDSNKTYTKQEYIVMLSFLKKLHLICVEQIK